MRLSASARLFGMRTQSIMHARIDDAYDVDVLANVGWEWPCT